VIRRWTFSTTSFLGVLWSGSQQRRSVGTAWSEGDAAERVAELLSLRPELAGLQLLDAVAEKKTPFDDNPRGPRNHDLLVHASTDGGPLVIGVEGKADEPFDLPLAEWRQKALERSPSSGAPARLDNLTRHFFNATLDTDDAQPPLAGLGYQLLSALAGTLADAQSDSARQAVLLIHEFVTDDTDDLKHRVNAEVLEAFLIRLGLEPSKVARSSDGWISDFIDVRGDGTWMPEASRVAVAKLVTNRRE
jgi:hypothetical protein